MINAEKVKSASTTTDTLKVIADAGDTISFGTGWEVETPTFIDGQFTHIVSEIAPGGTARVELRNSNMLQNPLNPFDADRDGKVVPLDALRIINELQRRGSGAFTLPTNDSEISKLYFDVNGDNRPMLPENPDYSEYRALVHLIFFLPFDCFHPTML